MKTQKILRKPLAILMAVCMLFQLVGTVSAVGAVSGTEIVIPADVEAQKAQQIINAINGELTISRYEDTISTLGLACIFGHSMAQTTARETNHRYYATAPRCRQVTYKVDYCTRSSCNYITYTQTTAIAVYCCS